MMTFSCFYSKFVTSVRLTVFRFVIGFGVACTGIIRCLGDASGVAVLFVVGVFGG